MVTFWYSTDTLPRKNGNFGTAAEKYQWYRVRDWSNTKLRGSVHVRRLVHGNVGKTEIHYQK